MTSFELRPLAIGELLDRAFTLFKRHVLLFVGIMAVPSVFGLLVGLAFILLSIGFGGRPPAFPQDRPPDLDQITGFLVLLVGGVVVFVLINWVVYMLALGATTVAVSELYVGRTPSIRSAYARVRGQIGPLLLLSLFALVRIGGLFVVIVMTTMVVSIMLTFVTPLLAPLLLFVALIGATLWCGFLALRYAVSVPALVLEQVSAATAIGRSIFLTRGHLGPVVLLVVCAMALTYAAAAVFQGPFIVAMMMAGQETTMGLALNLLGTVSGAVGSTLIAPIMVIGFAVLYYDLRIRKEALDLQMMIQALDAAPGSPHAGAPHASPGAGLASTDAGMSAPPPRPPLSGRPE